MTLIILTVNDDQATATMDRRLTFGGRLEDLGGEEERSTTKGFGLFCEYGRFIVCFTGLAEVRRPSFSTRKWLMDTLVKMPGQNLNRIVEEIRDEANRTIEALPILPAHRQLSIAMVGHSTHESGKRGFIAQVTNFDRFEHPESNPAPQPGEGFTWQILRAPPRSEGCSEVHVVGATQYLPSGEEDAIGSLVERRKSTAAIVNRSVKAIRRTNEATELVGRNCMSLILPIDPEEVGTTQFHADDDRPTVEHQFGKVVVEKGLAYIHDEPKMWATEDDGTAIPLRRQERQRKAKRNDPCWCGSGRKFKKCCGR